MLRKKSDDGRPRRQDPRSTLVADDGFQGSHHVTALLPQHFLGLRLADQQLVHLKER